MSTEDNGSTETAESSEGPTEESPLDETLDECLARVNRLIKKNKILLDQIE